MSGMATVPHQARETCNQSLQRLPSLTGEDPGDAGTVAELRRAQARIEFLNRDHVAPKRVLYSWNSCTVMFTTDEKRSGLRATL